MTDTLHRAWNVLEPGERPEGMLMDIGGVVGERWPKWDLVLSRNAAYDRLVVAVENVCLDLGLEHTRGPERTGRQVQWWRLAGDATRAYQDPDRLTAAVLALESERGSNA